MGANETVSVELRFGVQVQLQFYKVGKDKKQNRGQQIESY